MTSKLYTQIYPWLQALPVVLNGAVVTARGLNDPTTVVEADLPLRVLLATGAGNSGEITRLDIHGRHRSGRWSIIERFILTPVAQGRELQHYTAWLTQYIVALEETLNTHRHYWTESAVWRIDDPLRSDMGEYEYPLGSSQFYFGVQSEIPILEFFS